MRRAAQVVSGRHSGRDDGPVILFLTTADTEVLAAAGAVAHLPPGFPRLRAANPGAAPDAPAELERWLDELLADVALVLVRLLGGRRAWPAGFDRVRDCCEAQGVALLAFGGEDAVDAELTAASTVPSSVVAHAMEYLRHGGVENIAQLLRFVADTVLFSGFGFGSPTPIPPCGRYRPELEDRLDPARPTAAVVFYRAHFVAGNTAFVDALLDALDAAGVNPLAVYSYSLRPEADGRVPALELLADVDALVLTVLAMGGSSAADAESWEVPALRSLDIPVVQALCATGSRARWAASDAGLAPLDVAMQVAMPEFDGRVVTVPCSFKEEVPATRQGQGRENPAGPRAGAAERTLGVVSPPVAERLVRYVPDVERASRVAGIVARLALLRHTPNHDKRIAILLSNYPTRHS
ncbi:MAG: cobaltochelatase subunit CobN, partial [Actinomycetota bacterium]|nr:cobaltochelatase subunit CobN [Actinomycetota bacterium]